ncbi:unnamed protein product, partial [Meganyctiphanes norvegica]
TCELEASPIQDRSTLSNNSKVTKSKKVEILNKFVKPNTLQMNRCELNKRISLLCEKTLVTPKVPKDVNISRNKFFIELKSLRISYKSDQCLSRTQMVDMVNKCVKLDTQASRLTRKCQSFNNTVSCSQRGNKESVTKEASKFELHKQSDPVEYFNDKVSDEIRNNSSLSGKEEELTFSDVKMNNEAGENVSEVWKWRKRKSTNVVESNRDDDDFNLEKSVIYKKPKIGNLCIVCKSDDPQRKWKK